MSFIMHRCSRCKEKKMVNTETGYLCPSCESLTTQKDAVAESPAVMAGYVAKLESACFDIYMDFHVSETKNLSPAMKYVWSMGQEIWIKRQNKEAT